MTWAISIKGGIIGGFVAKMSVAYLCKYSRIPRSSSALASKLLPERAPPSVISVNSTYRNVDSLCQRATRYIDREVLVSNLGVGMKLGSNRRKIVLDQVVMYKQLQAVMSVKTRQRWQRLTHYYARHNASEQHFPLV